MAKLTKGIKKAVEGVKAREPKLPKPVTDEASMQERENAKTDPKHRASAYETIEVTGSTGKKYTLAIPQSYVDHIPKVWEWNETRFQVAEAIAAGIPIKHIADDPKFAVRHRMTIYGWLEHPEFRKHVDGLIAETGFASQRERIAGMTRLTQKLFDKVINELDSVKLTDKSIGAVLSGIQNGIKHLAQEKGEFVEHQNVTQQTTLSGAVGVAAINIEKVLQGTSEDERKKLEEEFDSMGDDIIRQITGDK